MAISRWFVAPGLLWLIAAPCGAEAPQVKVETPKVQVDVNLGTKKDKLDDQTFAKKAAQGGKAEVELGHLAEKHAQSDEVKKFGKRMVTDHSKANKELMAVVEKNKLEVPKGIGKEHKALFDKLSKLDGKEFDVEYMKAMVKDHEEDVAEFAEAAKTLKNDELKAFAANTLPVIQEHLKMAKSISGKLGGTTTGAK